MKEFTIKNICKLWLKMWPLTIILVLMGGVLGVLLSNKLAPTYETEMVLLVKNDELKNSTSEYAAIMNGLSKESRSCKITNSQAGNIISSAMICLEESDAYEISNKVKKEFDKTVRDVYGESIKITTIVNAGVEKKEVAAYRRIQKILIPVIFVFALSWVIALVRLDFQTSKRN